MPPNCQFVSEALKARGSTMIETALSSTEVREPCVACVWAWPACGSGKDADML